MTNKALFTLLLVASVAPAQADNVAEVEPNHPIAAPQRLNAPSGQVGVDAMLGNAADDVDFFRVYAKSGDVLSIDIDRGWGGAQATDTLLTVLDSDLHVLRVNDDSPSLDEGSTSTLDARIDGFVAPTTGFYYVGVSSWGRYIRDGGVVNKFPVFPGDYELQVSGMSPAVKQVPIDIKPGNNEVAPINPKSRGKIPVAVLSTVDFSAMAVDTSSLTFGATGAENSLSHCNKKGIDVNRDGRPDLLCHFNTEDTKFIRGDIEGKLKGRTTTGTDIEGAGYLKVVPEKK